MISLPSRAFVFKNFVLYAIISLTACVTPMNLQGNAPVDAPYEATDSSNTLESSSSEKSTPEPIRENENEPYRFPFEGEKTQEQPEDHFYGQFMKMLGTLGLLIAVMLLASRSLKRMLDTRVQGLNDNSLIKVLEKRPLSNKSFLYLVEIEGKTFVVGESMNSVNLLTVLENKHEEQARQN